MYMYIFREGEEEVRHIKRESVRKSVVVGMYVYGLYMLCFGL